MVVLYNCIPPPIPRSAELDILMTDLERANQRAASAEKQIETLSQSTSSQVTSAPDKVGGATVLYTLCTILVPLVGVLR